MVPWNPDFYERQSYFLRVLRQEPQALARVSGSAQYPAARGKVHFYTTALGTLVSAEIAGLPQAEDACSKPFFAFHIHSGSTCTGNAEDAFADAMGHYDPNDCRHPGHAGDLVPLLSNGGYAFQVFLTDRFLPQEVVGGTVIVHRGVDDFTTQPAGNAGEKIACGQIVEAADGGNR
jgi:Cu-Zn family superoxide dismutase